MHIPWNWIKQRPQFLAEELSKYYDLTVVYPSPYRRKNLVKEENCKLKNMKILRIPFHYKNKYISMLDRAFISLQIKKILLFNKFDIIWITHPYLYGDVLSNLNYNFRLIYDCMDDALSFPDVEKNNFLKNLIFEKERNLCMESNLIFSSSQHLKETLVSRYNIKESKIKVVNNGINLSSLKEEELPIGLKKYFDSEHKNIVYIGTISEWFDFEVIIKSLNEIKGIRYLLFGPSDVKIPSYKNIIHLGPVPHKYVFSIMKLSDVLIMPFKVNDLVKNVDPVKVYEYIFSGKPAIIKRYKETLKFEDFVFLYSDHKEYIRLLKDILNKNSTYIKGQNDKLKSFLFKATWSAKTEEIFNTINEL